MSMDLFKEIFKKQIYKGDNYQLFFEDILLFLAVIVCFVFLLRLLFKKLLPGFFKIYEVSKPGRIKIRTNALIIFLLCFCVAALWSLKLNAELYSTEYFTIKISNVLQAILIIKLAQILDNIITRIKNKNQELLYQNTTDQLPQEKETNQVHTIQWLVYLIVALMIVNFFEVDKPILSIKGYYLKISSILIVIIVLFGARLFAWFLTQILLQPYYNKNRIDQGAQYSVNQLLSYVIYVVSFFLAMNIIEVKMNLILGGAAALLVGVGLGLQQTFNDFFSGIILLFERSIDIGDIVNVNGVIGTVKRIGIRTSKIETRDNITVIVPNSKLVTDNVINWSHTNNYARFEIKIQASFTVDPQLIRQILIAVAGANNRVEQNPAPFVRFIEFGQYALEFHLLFWSKELINIEDVKSDLRFEINRMFKEHGIEIPYPIQSLYLKNHQSSE